MRIADTAESSVPAKPLRGVSHYATSPAPIAPRDPVIQLAHHVRVAEGLYLDTDEKADPKLFKRRERRWHRLDLALLLSEPTTLLGEIAVLERLLGSLKSERCDDDAWHEPLDEACHKALERMTARLVAFVVENQRDPLYRAGLELGQAFRATNNSDPFSEVWEAAGDNLDRAEAGLLATPATSLAGALAQIMAAQMAVGRITDNKLTEEETEAEARKVERVLYSVGAVLERATGMSAEAVGGAACMPDHANPWAPAPYAVAAE